MGQHELQAKIDRYLMLYAQSTTKVTSGGPTGKEVSYNQYVLYMTVLYYNCPEMCTPFEIQAGFQYQIKPHFVYFLAVSISKKLSTGWFNW